VGRTYQPLPSGELQTCEGPLTSKSFDSKFQVLVPPLPTIKKAFAPDSTLQGGTMRGITGRRTPSWNSFSKNSFSNPTQGTDGVRYCIVLRTSKNKTRGAERDRVINNPALYPTTVSPHPYGTTQKQTTFKCEYRCDVPVATPL